MNYFEFISWLLLEYDPNPLLTLEKKHRKRRHSSATATSEGCTGEHEESDCGEPYCAKVGKLEEDEEEDDNDLSYQHSSSKMLYWTWSGLGYKRPKCKKSRNKEFFHGIQRGDEVLNVGDAALFISTGNERPFIGKGNLSNLITSIILLSLGIVKYLYCSFRTCGEVLGNKRQENGERSMVLSSGRSKSFC